MNNLRSHLVLKAKRDTAGAIIKYKARLVAGGDAQVHGLDFDQSYAPVADFTVVRTRNATQHLQSVLVVMMDDIKSNIKVYLDDCLLHTKTEEVLLATLNFFFKKCQ
jgi:Reverse transcriptase (RNA-dependent DNA polymerase)